MTASEIRSALGALDLRPSRRLGQNFLADERVAGSVVGELELSDKDTVIEIGPGLGALSRHLISGPARRVVLIEKDARLAAFLRDEFFNEQPRVEVIHADATKVDLRPYFPKRPVKVVGNLPYSSGTEILCKFVQNPSPVSKAVFMLQREVAERLTAKPRTKACGILTFKVLPRWIPILTRLVPPDVFWPRPGVESAVIRLAPRDRASLPAFDERLLDRLVRHGFSQRRKQLKKLLPTHPAELPWATVAEELRLPETARAEELSLDHWVALTNLFDDHPLRAEAQSAHEIFDIVDENDAVVGQAPRGEVHARGLRHRAVHVFLFNAKGDLFLQMRSHLKDSHPGVWDSSAAGHLDSGEDYLSCARRELEEELGVRGVDLNELAPRIDACENTGWEFVQLYGAVSDAKVRYPCSEIETGAFFPIETVRAWAERRPQDFATGFLECLRSIR